MMTHDPQPNELFDALNENQRQAASHVEGPLLILAGPGSGKTRVLIHRIAHMIASGVPSHQIVALTFTNKAADEMSRRLDELVDEHHAWTGTFHRFCSRLLRTYAPTVGLDENFTIYDSSDSKRVIKQVVDDSDIDVTHYSPDQILGQISQAKSEAVTADEFSIRATNHLQKVTARLYPQYQDSLRDANAVDFDDLLLYVVQLLKENPQLRQSLDERYRYILVDEYQDTNACQYLILKGLSQNFPNLAVTGDPDQSIYGWRGASIRNIMDFEQDYPSVDVVRLEQNYRSTKSILSVADQLIFNNVQRKHKQLLTDNDEGIPVTLVAYPTQNQEANSIAETIYHQIEAHNRSPKDFAIFYRVNALSRSFEHALRLYNIPYQVVHGLEFYQRKEIKDLLAYLHLLNNPRDNLAIQRIINVPARKIGKITLGKLRQYAQDNGISILEAARQAGMIETISKQAAAKVAGFVALYDRLTVHLATSVEEILGHVLAETGYREFLMQEDTEEADNRIANVDEFLTAAQEFDQMHPDDGGLERFLETAVLVSDTDAWEASTEAVTLMTLHAAKGLEFPSVFIVGLEDGTLPHERSMRDEQQIEEERRLLFVGITRAEKELQLSRALYRFRRGANWPTVASRFLMELPREQMTVIEPRGIVVPDDVEYDLDQTQEDQWMEELSKYQSKPATSVETKQSATIKTAAQMMDEAETPAEAPVPRVPPSVFHQGMLVSHPEYGTGHIVALSGQGKKRIATVDFFGNGQRKFRLAQSPLQPIGQNDG